LEVVEYFREILSENLTNTPRIYSFLGKEKVAKGKGPVAPKPTIRTKNSEGSFFVNICRGSRA
jgi:hypothetical protein